MSFMNLAKAAAKYTDEPMKGNIQRLTDFDAYHCLIAGSLGTSLKLQDKYPCFPMAYLDWTKICDGGLLFDTVMLSTKGHDDKLDLDFDTYDDMNSADAYSDFNLPEGYVVFAMRSYGDPICFNANEKDGKVYLWDKENADFSDIWDTFADWLTEEIDDGVKLIADDVLEPLSIKAGGDEYE
jgi:hypothetical protein